MKRTISIFIFCGLLYTAAAQDSTDYQKSTQQAVTTVDEAINNSRRKSDSAFLANNARNLDAFIKAQNEATERKKKKMYLQLGLGITFLIIFIIGMMRKRKK
jgi:hypothetical protein